MKTNVISSNKKMRNLKNRKQMQLFSVESTILSCSMPLNSEGISDHHPQWHPLEQDQLVSHQIILIDLKQVSDLILSNPTSIWRPSFPVVLVNKTLSTPCVAFILHNIPYINPFQIGTGIILEYILLRSVNNYQQLQGIPAFTICFHICLYCSSLAV